MARPRDRQKLDADKVVETLDNLYAGESDDPVIVAAVNDIETLASDLGRKIWQKIMILGQLDEARAS